MWFFQRLFWWFRRPTYEIISSQSFVTAEEAAKSAQVKVNAAGGECLGIAADAYCCDTEGGMQREFNVYALIKH